MLVLVTLKSNFRKGKIEKEKKMPFDSQGKFTRIHNWEDDRINDIEIVTDHHDEEDNNFADGLSQAVLRDGRTTMIGNLNMGNFQIKNMADAIVATDGVNKKQLTVLEESVQEKLKASEEKVNTSLSQTLNYSTLTNCVVAAPNGVAICSGNAITVQSKLKVLIPDGRDSNGGLKNLIYELDTNRTINMFNGSDLYLYLRADGACFVANFQGEYASVPTARFTNDYYYNVSDNQMYTANNSLVWEKTSVVVIARNVSGNGSAVTSFIPSRVVRILHDRDHASIVNWITPNYKAGISISSGYTAPVSGFVYCKAYGVDQAVNNIYVNGHLIFDVYREHIDLAPITLFLGKGDVLAYNGGTITCLFFPCKGAY